MKQNATQFRTFTNFTYNIPRLIQIENGGQNTPLHNLNFFCNKKEMNVSYRK